MARNTKEVNIELANRDHGKRFLLTEMPAHRAERWATRAFFALGRAGIELPAGLEEVGWAGLAVLGLRAMARLDFEDAEPLLDEMMTCVEIVPDPERFPQIHRPLVEDDVEEVSTRMVLRSEVFELHTGFSVAGAFSTLGEPAEAPK